MNYSKILLPLLLSLTSCSTFLGSKNIVRWPDKYEEKVSRNILSTTHPSIFEDYQWTTPNLKSYKLVFHTENDKRMSSLTFDNTTYTIELTEDENLIISSGKEHHDVLNLETSSNDIYYDISTLDRVLTYKMRWVSKTTFETQSVMVTKTRSVPVTTFGPNGTSSTSFKTEFYTENEFRTVPVTKMEWESYPVYEYRIPQFEYYKFPVRNNRLSLYIYKVIDGQKTSYYVQNPSYVVAEETQQALFGQKKVNILLLDNNCNGSYTDKEDLVMFNVWNPYSQNSTYRTLDKLNDNYWYKQELIENEKFMTFTIQDNHLQIDYANQYYVGNEEQGTLVLDNKTDLKVELTVNGKKYRDAKPGINNYSCELGLFNYVISTKGHLDYSGTFKLTSIEEPVNIEYVQQKEACILEIKNIFSKSYSVTVESENFNKTYYNVTKINVPIEKVKMMINVNGFIFSKEMNMKTGTNIIDFEKEIKELSEAK
ncbi:hypothetical protein [Spirochaeta cellobiosiphila]|uniref:hypothetical protein n=1 Tax=Spirochaeta cellobiosiphila TaxID=504483 RepID=UPI000407E942|nr:hypothetical protein [Spirochaeta cellobiosiphila]